VVAHAEATHTGPDLLDDARPLMPSDHRQGRTDQVTGTDVVIRMAQPGGFERNQDLALFGWIEFDLFDRPLFVHSPQHR
jgi:hypothetical protein